MLNTSVSPETEEKYYEYAHKTADMQNGGRMDLYMERAVALARGMGITVCDCYSRWREMSRTRDITELLANYINHPSRELHQIFADTLFETLEGEV